MIGGIELGGTKCVLAVANNPLDIVEKKIVPTRDPHSTIVDIKSFFSNFKINRLGIGLLGRSSLIQLPQIMDCWLQIVKELGRGLTLLKNSPRLMRILFLIPMLMLRL